MKRILFALFLITNVACFSQKTENFEKYVDSMTQMGQKDKLIPLFEKKLKLKPNNEELLRKLGYLYLQDNNLEKASIYYNKSIIVNPKCGNCYAKLAIIYAYKKDNDKALEFFDKAILVEPKNAKLYINRAEFKNFLKNKLSALTDFNKAIAIEPLNANFYVARGKFNSEENYLTLAMLDFDKAIELEPKNFKHYLSRCEVFFNQGNTENAFKDANVAIALNPKAENCFITRGVIFNAIGNYEKANEDYTTASILNPKNSLPFYNRSKSKYKLEDMDGSCEDLAETIKLLNLYDAKNPIRSEIEVSIENYCNNTKPSYYYQRGIAYYNLRKLEESIAIYTKGLEKFPTNAMSLSFRGNAFYESQKYENALKDYKTALENKDNLIIDIQENQNHTGLNTESIDKYVDGFVASIHLTSAQSYFALNKFDDALVEINNGIKIAPNLKEFGLENYYNVRGLIYIQLSQSEKAISDFETCLKLKISFPLALVNRALAKMNLKNKFQITTQSFSGGFNNSPFQVNSVITSKTKIDISDGNLLSALIDCNQAIKENPNFGYAYYIRSEIKRLLKYDDYCVDLKKAKSLNYFIDESSFLNCN
jgi:tetratricopeptide (TPR) repeat protein